MSELEFITPPEPEWYRRYAYADADGRLVKVGQRHASHPDPEAIEGLTLVVGIEAVSALSHYWNGSAMVARGDLPITASGDELTNDGADTLTFSNVPAGTRVSMKDSEGLTRAVIDDGSMEITTNLPAGLMHFEFEHPHYQPARFQVSIINAP